MRRDISTSGTTGLEIKKMAELKRVSEGQRSGNCYRAICPRCGDANMNQDLAMNALSRFTSVYICSQCGTGEALGDEIGQDPFGWFCTNLR